jgi:ABC-2 type transport system ATP-binding protein
MNYAIETINLVKRYPTATKRTRGERFHHRRDHIYSFSSLFNAIRGIKGPFIEALRGVNLKVKSGEVFGILGPNGAGKTTLIKILCTLVLHDEGEAYVNGFNVQEEPNEVLKNLQAVLPGSRGFNWRLTGRHNLEFYALLYGLKKKEAEERINYLLDFMGLKERADDKYQRYSTGMQRKLLLCRALLRDTPIILFDEPTVGLDPSSAVEFQDLLRDRLAREEGKTIFFSTHNLYESQRICDRIAILDGGKITACDTPDNIRYMMFDERILEITLINAVYNRKCQEMIEELEKIEGIHGVTPEVKPDGSFQAISIRFDVGMDLSDILEVVAKNRLKIKAVNTYEPTLEDAFIAITRQGRPRFGGYRRRRSQ